MIAFLIAIDNQKVHLGTVDSSHRFRIEIQRHRDALTNPAMIETLINVAFCVSSVLTLLIFLLPSQYDPRSAPSGESSSRPKTSVQILVLGDIGRSPRMQYHALSIARNGGRVVIIGYKGELAGLHTPSNTRAAQYS